MRGDFGFLIGLSVLILCMGIGSALNNWAKNPTKTETSSHLRESRLQLPCPQEQQH